jgi:hypothetical protein
MEADSLCESDVVVGASPDCPLAGLYRVLEIRQRSNSATLIPIPQQPRKSPDSKQKNYYAKGFIIVQLSQLKQWLETRQIQRTELNLPPHWHMSDAELRAMLNRGPDRQAIPPALTRRDATWKLIEPLVPAPIGAGTPQHNLACLDALVKQRAREAKASAGKVYDALHRFYAYGCILNALLPQAIGRCGNPGKARFAKNGIKLGRKNTAYKAGKIASPGLPLTERDVENIQDFYRLIRRGRSTKEAFVLMGAAFYSTGHSMRHGELKPDLLPHHQRPTFEQFLYRGPRGPDARSIARQLMGEGEWLKNHRPLRGTSRDGVIAAGQTGSLDASPIDVHLVSCFNPLQSIGVGRALFVRDIYSGLFLGWTVSERNPTVEDAKLAILRAAEPKEQLLQKYRLDFPADDFPSLLFAKYQSDNGELRCKDGITVISDNLESKVEFIRSHRPELNSPSETGHQIRHKTLDHQLPGTTFGRQTQRGEEAPVVNSVLSKFAYMQVLIDWIHWFNAEEKIDLRDIPVEMQRDFAREGKPMKRTRLELFRWAKSNNYITGQAINLSYLRAHLLPKFQATIKRDGIWLHRPGDGANIELLKGAKFNDSYLAESGLMREAISRKSMHIEVRADPDDLAAIYIIDRHGVHRIPNVKDDEVLLMEGSVADLCSMNDAQTLANSESVQEVEQALCDKAAFRSSTISAEKAKKDAAIGRHGKPTIKKAKSGIRDAQDSERSARFDDALRALNVDSQKPSVTASVVHAATGKRAATGPKPTLSLLEQHRIKLLTDHEDE